MFIVIYINILSVFALQKTKAAEVTSTPPEQPKPKAKAKPAAAKPKAGGQYFAEKLKGSRWVYIRINLCWFIFSILQNFYKTCLIFILLGWCHWIPASILFWFFDYFCLQFVPVDPSHVVFENNFFVWNWKHQFEHVLNRVEPLLSVVEYIYKEFFAFALGINVVAFKWNLF